MMVPSKSLIAGLALAAMGTVGNAQQTGLKTHKVNGIGHATLNVATGEIVRGQGAEKSAALAPNFSNTDTSGFFSGGDIVSSLGGPEEWLDWGTVTTDTGSDIVGEFDFGYATFVNDPSIGGPGVSFQMRFYDGVLGGCADSGGLVSPSATFTFTGLPGVTVSGNNGWVITADLRGGFEFCDAGAPGSAFGFSVTTTDDDGANGWNTGPLLCYAGDGLAGPDSNGQVDLFDQYDTDVNSGTCLGTFFFGGPPVDISSWYLESRTAAPDPGGADNAAVVQMNGTGVNPNNFVMTTGFVLGGTAVGSDLSTSGGLGILLAGYSSPLVFPTGFGELLVNPTGGELLAPAGAGGPFLFAGGVATIGISVPKDLNLCGITVYAQAVEFGGGIALHNANALTIGF